MDLQNSQKPNGFYSTFMFSRRSATPFPVHSSSLLSILSMTSLLRSTLVIKSYQGFLN